MQMNYLHVVSNTHLCKYPFSILWPDFLDVSDITLLCWMLEKVVNIEIYRPFLPLWPYLSCLQNNPPENNVEPVLAKSEPVQLCGCAGFLLWFLPNLSCLQNNPPENNVEQFPLNLSCLKNNPPENNVEDLTGTRFTLFSSKLFWDRFILDLRSFFDTCFRYKLM